MAEYFAELVFDEWSKKTSFGTNKSETNNANKLMAETERVIEKMKFEEEAAPSNTAGDLKADAKGKRKMEK
jgi:hypothetical protein